MQRKDSAKERVIFNITTLMLIFLPLSTLANYLNGRTAFSILYLFMFVATVVHMRCYQKERDLGNASEKLMIILSGLFFAFFLIGEQSTFDVFWILILPMVGMILLSYARLTFWIRTINAIYLSMMALAYVTPQWVRYDTFALWSLLWAMIFMSGVALYYNKSQERLEKEIQRYEQNLEIKIEEAIGEIEQLNNEIESTQIEIVERLGTLGEFRSLETGAHVRRVGMYAKELGLLAGLSESEAEILEQAAPLHDIGKVGIEDSILNKPAKLTAEEYERMKAHTLIGERILAGSDKELIQKASEIAGGHHEKYDGSGYPRALSGEAIPLSARIVAIADVFDALYSTRVYKKSWSLEAIVELFEKESGKHFDPHLIGLFLDNLDRFVHIYDTNP
jgi:HD superfamily phosphodiesterase